VKLRRFNRSGSVLLRWATAQCFHLATLVSYQSRSREAPLLRAKVLGVKSPRLRGGTDLPPCTTWNFARLATLTGRAGCGPSHQSANKNRKKDENKVLSCSQTHVDFARCLALHEQMGNICAVPLANRLRVRWWKIVNLPVIRSWANLGEPLGGGFLAATLHFKIKPGFDGFSTALRIS
jgi:hypothetical protein